MGYEINRKYVGPIHGTPHQTGGSLRPVGFLREEGGRRWIKQVRLIFSRSARLARKASEICLRASEKTVGESLTGLGINCCRICRLLLFIFENN